MQGKRLAPSDIGRQARPYWPGVDGGGPRESAVPVGQRALALSGNDGTTQRRNFLRGSKAETLRAGGGKREEGCSRYLPAENLVLACLLHQTPHRSRRPVWRAV